MSGESSSFNAIPTDQAPSLDFLEGGGEMGLLIRRFDWESSPLGPPVQWAQSLRTALRIMLACDHPMLVMWGPDLIQFYNDAFRPSIGSDRHPSSLGQPAREAWAEIWHIQGPKLMQVIEGRGAVRQENAYIPITRNGRKEEVYWTYSYNPIDDPTAQHGVGGILVICTDTTRQVQAITRLTEENERFAELFAQAPTFMAVLRGPNHRIELTNPGYDRLIGYREVVGKTVEEALPEAVSQGYLEILNQVYRTGVAYSSVGARYAMQTRADGPVDERYVDFVYQPIRDSQGQVTGIFVEGVDVTARHFGEVRRDALFSLTSRLQDIDDVGEIAYVAAEIIGTTLGVSRVGYGSIDPEAETLHVERDWTAPGVATLAGTLQLRDYGSFIDSLKRGELIQIDDVRKDPRTAEASEALEGKSARAFVNLPIVEHGCLRAVLFVNHAEVRNWTAEDTQFISEVGARTRTTVERMRNTAELREREAQLRESDRRKDEFIATLAHELRNPLAPIRNGLEIARLAGEAREHELLQNTLEMMDRQLNHVIRLVDDLMDVGRINSGKVELKRGRIGLNEVLTRSIESVQTIVEAHRHQLEVGLGSSPLHVDGDFDRLSQVFSNLISNAAKYTDDGGTISVTTFEDDGFAVVAVEDTGIGIPPEELPKVFDLFSQVRSHQGRAEGGLGIGLALVRRILDLHGATISAQSEGIGRGSRFVVRLPLLAEAPADSGSDIGSADLRSGASPLHILVVDDNVDAATSLSMLLDLKGHRVSLAHDGLEAIESCEREMPDLVLLDLGMPRIGGEEAARRIRSLPSGDGAFIVALTGWGQESARERTRSAGFNHHLVKPVSLEELEAVVSGLERNRQGRSIG